MKPNGSHPDSRIRGFSLVELLVAVVIGMALVLALTTIMVRHDGGKRTLISTNDLSLTSSFVSYAIDSELRSAGTGFTQDWRTTYGCLLRVARNGAQILPRATPFPAPFAAVPQQVRLAPLLIHAGAGNGGSDVLAVATGASGLGETPIRVQPLSTTANDLRVTSTVGLRTNDLVLVAEDAVGCMVQQVAAPALPYGANQLLSFGGVYADDEIAGLQLTNFGTANVARVSVLGNTAGNRPMLRLLGVGGNDLLFSYDLLRLDGTDTALPVAAGVVDLRALYGVDTGTDGIIDTWVPPTGLYSAASLSADTLVAKQRLLSIMAVRIGLVLHSDRIERDDVAPASLSLFSDLDASLHYSFAIAADDRRQRFRTVEFTVPLRNVMLTAR